MARAGLYKSDVQKARDALIAQGKKPSVDAVRVALGNTGSKTTIHRYLRELEEEEGGGPARAVAVSEALQDLVARLATRLQEEAEAILTRERERHGAELQRQQQALSGAQEEAAALSSQLQRTEASLHQEQAAHALLQQNLGDRIAEIAQLNERIAGMTVRLADHEAHTRSLEDKHAHAREALEHYRTSTKEQREQELRRHEHQVQELQVALRQANEALGAKNQELLVLNRDNGQWLERHGRIERELAQLRQAHEGQHSEVVALRQTATDHLALQERWKTDAKALDAMRNELTQVQDTLTRERERRESAEADALRANARLGALEPLLNQLTPAQNAVKKTRRGATQGGEAD
ncbi:DNA-binding protein [Pseudoxanthomonas sp.]|jgi:Chromosome segregation ATPases|uniref:DNA-binding protein n=1 Tax=Pseudoxanthomonas sp. TaxID=1871049 RepID=UPI002FE3B1A2